MDEARATLEELERARARNLPAAWDAARTRFEAQRDRASALLVKSRTRPGVAPEALAAIEAGVEALEQVALPPRPDGLDRVAVEPELEALRTAVCPDEMPRYDWHRWVNARLRALVEGMPPRDSDVLAHRMARRAPGDSLGCWLASRLNAADLLDALRDPKRRARVQRG